MRKATGLFLSICIMCIICLFVPIAAYAQEDSAAAPAGKAVTAANPAGEAVSSAGPASAADPDGRAVSSANQVGAADPAGRAVDSAGPASAEDPAGKAVTSEGAANGANPVQDPAAEGWVTKDGKRYYYWNGEMLKGLYQIDGYYYHFDESTGVMTTGWKLISDKRYYFRKNGSLAGTMWTEPGWKAISKYRYYFIDAGDGKACAKRGWLKLDGKRYHLSDRTGALARGWRTIEGKRYYFSEKRGVMATGWKKIDGYRYYFSRKTGVMTKGWKFISGKRYYFRKKGSLKGAVWSEPGWKVIKSNRYYFVSAGNGKAYAKRGWLKLGENWYHLSKKTGVMNKGWKTISGKRYYFRKSGVDKGVMQTGLKKIKGYRYYFSPGGVMQTGVISYNGNLYYFRENGKGISRKGWFKGTDRQKRYSLGNGRILAGTKKVKGIWYEFSDTSGALERRIGDDVDKRIQSYSSSTKYLIIVKISEHKVRIYKGRENNWQRNRTFRCTNGAPSTPTVRGTFRIGSRGLYFDTGTAQRCWYWTQFRGNYLFHSVIYDRSPSPSHVVDGRLGISASHGCVRLALGNAKWIYSHIPRGTKVVVY